MNDAEGQAAGQPGGAQQHHRALENLYRSAPVNALFDSEIEITGEGTARISFNITEASFHAAGAAQGTIYFKMLDDAAFYAANAMVPDQFVLTTQFNLFLTRPVTAGQLVALGAWVSGRRRVLIAESRLLTADGEEVARGQGTFMRSRIPLASLPGYASAEAG